MDVNICSTPAVTEVPVYLSKRARLMKPAFACPNLEAQGPIRLQVLNLIYFIQTKGMTDYCWNNVGDFARFQNWKVRFSVAWRYCLFRLLLECLLCVCHRCPWLYRCEATDSQSPSPGPPGTSCWRKWLPVCLLMAPETLSPSLVTPPEEMRLLVRFLTSFQYLLWTKASSKYLNYNYKSLNTLRWNNRKINLKTKLNIQITQRYT